MKQGQLHLADLRSAYGQLAGVPVDVLEFRQQTAVDRIPSALNVLFFEPSEEEQLPEDEHFTMLATEGMSIHMMEGPCPHVELILIVQGRHSRADLLALGRHLAEFAVLPFRDKRHFAPNILVHKTTFPLFTGMDAVLLTNLGVSSPEWLPNITPPVQLLCLKPVFESEADIISQIGDVEACHRFLREGISWDVPQRPPARLRQFPYPSPVAGGIRTRRRSTMASIETKIRELWKDVEEWYREHASNLLDDLHAPVTKEQLQTFQTQTGLSLPKDYHASLRIHDGEVYVHDYQYLSLESALRTWNMMKQLDDQGAFKDREVFDDESGRIQNVWWHPSWIPFAEDGGGNLLCIDMAPGVQGVVGQILQMEMAAGPVATESTSFQEWFTQYRDTLQQGHYEVDADGLIVEKI